MKKKWLLVAGLVSIIAIAGLVGCSTGSAATGEITQLNLSSQQQGIWVTGQGEVSVVPDIATLRLGVEADAESVAEAQDMAIEAKDKVIAALTGNGVAKKDIQTRQFSISKITKWDRNTEEEVVTGYRVTHMVTVKVRDIDSTGAIIDAVAEAGGDLTRIDSINFSVEDPTDYYEEAREEAMKDAKAKAKQLADLAGVTLGKATYVSESTYAPPIYTRSVYEVEEKAVGTSISPGELDISINLQVSYAIR